MYVRRALRRETAKQRVIRWLSYDFANNNNREATVYTLSYQTRRYPGGIDESSDTLANYLRCKLFFESSIPGWPVKGRLYKLREKFYETLSYVIEQNGINLEKMLFNLNYRHDSSVSLVRIFHEALNEYDQKNRTHSELLRFAPSRIYEIVERGLNTEYKLRFTSPKSL